MQTIRQTHGYWLVMLAAIVLFGCGRGDGGAGSEAHEPAAGHTSAESDDYYTCPMHPSVRSDRPGACPVCGMALVKKSTQNESPADTAALRTVSLSPTQRIIANVTTVPAVRGTLSREIDVVGIVAAAEPLQATVAARFRGRIEKLYVSATGQKVRKGDSLFDLYSPDMISAQQDFLLALQAKRTSVLSGISGTSSMQTDLLDASRNRLRIHFGLTEGQIGRLETSGQIRNTLTFFSPISGTVLQKEVQHGMYVEEGMTLYQFADLSTVWAYLDLYEKDLVLVKTGQPITVAAEAYPGRTFNGRVTFVDPVVDPGTRTVRVRTELPNREGLLLPNMFVHAHLSAASDPAIVLPQSAVLSTGPRSVVWVEVERNRFEPRDVVVGASGGGQVEILRGIREGEMVAQTGGFLIDSESALQMPAAADPQAEHTAADAGDRGTTPAGGSKAENKAIIVVDGRYIPNIVRVKRDSPVMLEFQRNDSGICTNEVIISDLDIRRELPEGQTTTVKLPPQQPGEIHFTCGMGMLHGTVIVE